MDKYDAANDHYCYRGSPTLKNKLNIENMDELEKAEREITAITARKITYSPPPYSLAYMKMLHRQLFADLYDWADIQQQEWVQANIDGVAVDYEPMSYIFKRIIKTCM